MNAIENIVFERSLKTINELQAAGLDLRMILNGMQGSIDAKTKELVATQASQEKRPTVN